MCGINGFLYAKPCSRDLNTDVIKRMNSHITYRGPDDEGIFVDETVALGMRRLSIIDLCTGNQPIYNEDGTKVIIFNGEIYNFGDLTADLVTKGHVFKTQGDTETILHAYEEYGEDCLKKLKGMFAFAIYDLTSKKLFIGRDRAGEKPLYFYHNNDSFVFSSELKSIIRVFNIRKEINKTALNQYLSLTYIPAPLTIFEEIYKLEAGTYLVYENHSGVRIQPYWEIDITDGSMITDYEICKRLLRESLFHSVEKMMISDVPLGAFLSGGIDSSIIVGIMSKLSSRPVETFTMGFKEKAFDESGRASAAASRNRTNHHLNYLDYDDALNYLDIILETLDEPFADSSAIPTYFVSKYASEHVKVVLTGDAGDELFGGYSKYLINYYSDIYRKIPESIRKNVIEKVVYAIPDRTPFTRKIKKVIKNSNEDIFQRRKNLMQLGFHDGDLSNLLEGDYYEKNKPDLIDAAYYKFNNIDELCKTLYTDFKVVLEGDMLVKVDRMSMLNSIETRVPMLDPDVVETAFKIPSEYKIRGRHQKFILKDTFKDLIPEELMKKTKSGFAVPIGEWFKGPLKKELLGTLSCKTIEEQGIFKYETIQRLLNEHMDEIHNHSSQLWALYIFQNWYNRYYSAI